jgi:ectoine hydroxylase-related dioxygenase (phytanoyl-CoA dioxygenase family)
MELNMTLTPDQVTFFKDHGYLPVQGFFTPREARAMQLEIERFKRTGLVRNVATAGDGKTTSTAQRNLQLCPMFDKSDLFKALPFDARVVSAITALIGQPARLHLDQVFLKPAGDGVGTAWHQDNAYFQLRNPMQGTALWIAVHDATLANGTLEVIPDQFLEKLEHQRDPNSDHHIRCWPEESKAVPVELKAGGAIFFCYGTPHCTRGNGTDHDRAGAAFHFLRTDANDGAFLQQWGPARPGNPHLTGSLASDGVQEYGKRMTGIFAREVEAILDAAPAG